MRRYAAALSRHLGEGGFGACALVWIPAYAGMTAKEGRLP